MQEVVELSRGNVAELLPRICEKVAQQVGARSAALTLDNGEGTAAYAVGGAG